MKRLASLRRSAAVAAIWLVGSMVASGQEISRLWVDVSGRHSTYGSLIDVDRDQQLVRLLTEDGRELTIPMDQLSQRDREYIKTTGNGLVGRNQLRSTAPSAPERKPLEPLILPTASKVAPPDHVLSLGVALPPPTAARLPMSLPADPPRQQISGAEANVSIRGLDFNDLVSRPVIISGADSESSAAAIGLSVSQPIGIPGQQSRQQLIRFDLDRSRGRIAMQHDRRIHLLDHHPGSRQSLVLVDFGPIGEGGTLAFAHGWQASNLSLSNQRKLPEPTLAQPPIRIRWARFLDAQHVLVAANQSVMAWNLVSGKVLYRIDQIDKRTLPALSGGRRFLALPRNGRVDLYATDTGRHLGQINVEKGIPGVGFSPFGNALAIASSRRIRVWNLPGAALDNDIKTRESIGIGPVTWLDHDTLLTSNGVVFSLSADVPFWKYDLTGCQVTPLGDHVAILRKTPSPQLTTMKLPHADAAQTLLRIRLQGSTIDYRQWRLPGRSKWNGNGWADQQTRITRAPSHQRR